jgi:hypothetical protein
MKMIGEILAAAIATTSPRCDQLEALGLHPPYCESMSRDGALQAAVCIASEARKQLGYHPCLEAVKAATEPLEICQLALHALWADYEPTSLHYCLKITRDGADPWFIAASGLLCASEPDKISACVKALQ